MATPTTRINFGGYKYFSDVVTTPLFDFIPNPLSDAIVRAILTGMDTSDHILAATLTGYNLKLRRLFRYGEQWEKDKLDPNIPYADRRGYVFGLPHAWLDIQGLDPVVLAAWMRSIPISVVDNPPPQGYFGKPIIEMLVFFWLQQSPTFASFNLDTLTMSYMGKFYRYAGYTIRERDDTQGIGWRLSVTLEALDPFESDLTVVPGIVPSDLEKDCIQAYYVQYPGGPKRVLYRPFDPNDAGMQVLIDTVTPQTEVLQGGFYPAILLKSESVWVDDVRLKISKDLLAKGMNQKWLFKTTKNALKKIDIDYNDLKDNILGNNLEAEDLQEYDPNTGDPLHTEGELEKLKDDQKKEIKKQMNNVKGLYLVFALDIYTIQKASVDYLFDFFVYLDNSLAAPRNVTQRSVDAKRLVIQDESLYKQAVLGPDGEIVITRSFNVTLEWKNISVSVKQGTVIDTDTTFTGLDGSELKYPEKYFDFGANPVFVPTGPLAELNIYRESDLKNINQFGAKVILPRKKIKPSDPTDDQAWIEMITEDRGLLVLRRQIDSTNFQEVIVEGLSHTSYVFSDDEVQVVTAFLSNYDAGDVASSGELDRDGFILPVSRAILEKSNGLRESDIVYDSMRLVMYVQDKQKIPWYQSGIFRLAMTIISVILILYAPYSTPAVKALMSLFGMTSVASFQALMIFLTVVTPMIVEKLVEHGSDIAMALAVAAVLFTAFVSFGGSLKTFLSQGIIQILNQSINAIGSLYTLYTGYEMRDLEAEFRESIMNDNELKDEIERVKDLLGDPSTLDLNPLYLSSTNRYIPMESPEAFLNRTYNAAASTDIIMDMTFRFTELSLELPETVFTINDDLVYPV